MVSQSSRFYKIDQLNEAGPASYLSPCSDPGLSWITNRIGDSTYQSNAVSMISANNQKLKLKNNINKTRVPGPSPDLSLLYTYGRISDVSCHDIYVTDHDLLKK